MQNYPPSKNLPKITVAVMESLTSYDWPGNVRELINTMHRYLTFKKLDFLDSSFINASQPEPSVPVEARETHEPLDATMKRFEKLYLTKVLDDYHWQQSKVSALLRVDPKTLYRKIKTVPSQTFINPIGHFCPIRRHWSFPDTLFSAGDHLAEALSMNSTVHGF